MNINKLTLFFLIFISIKSIAQLGIKATNTAPDAKAMLDVESADKGVLIPRMNTAARDAIASPPNGLMIYNNQTNKFNYFDGAAWQETFFGNQWAVNGTSLSHSGGNVGIGTTTPIAPLNILGGTSASIQFNTTGTGTTANDGFFIGNNSSGQGIMWNYENANLRLGTNNTERLTITNTGNVGINTNNPVAPVNIFSGTEARLQLNTTSSGTTVNDGLYLGQNSTNNGFVWNIENAGLAFGTNNTEKMSILSNGNVGIGNTNPSQKLSVNGNIVAPTLSLNALNLAPNANAILDIGSTTKGILIPRMTTAQRNFIPNTAGLMVYDTDTDGFWFNNGVDWFDLNSTWERDEAITYTHAVNNSTVIGIGLTPLPTSTTPSTPGGSVTNGRLQIVGSNNSDNLTLRHPSSPIIRWGFYVSSIDSSLNFYYNGSLRANIDRVTGKYTQLSDRNLKKNIIALNPVLNNVLKLKAYDYNMADSEPNGRKSMGFMAQDVQPLFPELVYNKRDRETNEPFLMMDYSSFGVIAIKAIQEQQTIINSLQSQIDELKKMVGALKK